MLETVVNPLRACDFESKHFVTLETGVRSLQACESCMSGCFVMLEAGVSPFRACELIEGL